MPLSWVCNADFVPFGVLVSLGLGVLGTGFTHRQAEPWLGLIVKISAGVVFFLFFMAIPWLRAPRTAHIAGPVAPYNVAKEKVLMMRPLGALLEQDVDALARAIEARAGVPVVILPPAPPPPEAFDFESGQYDATEMLDWLFMTRPKGAWRYMGILPDHMGTWDTQDVHGLASLDEGVAVVSMRHFRWGLRSNQPMKRAAAMDQLARVTFHELAHTLGLPHCTDDRRCLLRGITDKRQITPTTAPCDQCVQRIQQQLGAPRDPHPEAQALGDGYYRRGYHTLALEHYRQMRRTVPWDADATHRAEVENRLGAVFLSQELIAQSEFHVHRALQLDPGHAPALSNPALLEAHKHNIEDAIGIVEQAMALEDDPIERHEFSAIFYLDAIQDEGAALMSLRNYQQAGGQDGRLLAELHRLENQGFIIFDIEEAEVIVGASEP